MAPCLPDVARMVRGIHSNPQVQWAAQHGPELPSFLMNMTVGMSNPNGKLGTYWANMMSRLKRLPMHVLIVVHMCLAWICVLKWVSRYLTWAWLAESMWIRCESMCWITRKATMNKPWMWHKVRFKFVLCQTCFLIIMCWQWQLCSISFWAPLHYSHGCWSESG